MEESVFFVFLILLRTFLSAKPLYALIDLSAAALVHESAASVNRKSRDNDVIDGTFPWCTTV